MNSVKKPGKIKGFFKSKALHKWLAAYGIKLTAFYLIFLGLFHLINSLNGFHWLELIEANLIFQVMRFFYPGIILQGNILSNLIVAQTPNNFAVVINQICLGWFPIAAFASMILALPKIPLNKKFHSLFLGVIILFAANLLRVIIILLAAALHGLESFDFMHLVAVKVDLMVLVSLLFFACLKHLIGEKTVMESIKVFS